MPERASKLLQNLATALSVVVSFLAIGMVFFNGGSLAQTVKDQGSKIAIIETVGSRAVTEHVKADDERIAALKQRLDKLESAIDAIHGMRADLQEIRARIEEIRKDHKP